MKKSLAIRAKAVNFKLRSIKSRTCFSTRSTRTKIEICLLVHTTHYTKMSCFTILYTRNIHETYTKLLNLHVLILVIMCTHWTILLSSQDLIWYAYRHLYSLQYNTGIFADWPLIHRASHWLWCYFLIQIC